MIPLTLAGPTMPWPGAGSHADGRFSPLTISPRQLPPRSGQPDQAADILRRRASGAEFAQAGGLRRLREFSPLAIEGQAVVPVGRPRQAEQLLPQPADAGRPEQVLAPHHVGHALQGVVDHYRKMIAVRRLLARQDDIAPGL